MTAKNKKNKNKRSGKSWAILFCIVDYYIRILGLTHKELYDQVCKWRLKKKRRSIDEGSIPNAYRNRRICHEFHGYILRYLRENIDVARKDNQIDPIYIPMPLDLVTWPNETIKKKYYEILKAEEEVQDE